MKVKIESCEIKKQGTGKNGKPYTIYNYRCSSGSDSFEADSFDKYEQGQEIEVEVREDNYGKHLVSAKQAGKKKDVALLCAAIYSIGRKEMTAEDVIALSDKFNL